jgi:small conductance mechanosensitive channel
VAIPGQVPLGIELVLQPSLAVIKFLAVTLASFLLRSLSTFLLSQWAADVDVPQRLQSRRQQRYRSLLSTTHRLINVVGIGVVLLWVLLDIPGVRSASVSLLLAGVALLGALAFVFQGLLRDFSAGLVMLLEDRYAIGDWIEVEGIEGEVIEMGLFSTQIRCLDQRMNILDNSSILQMRNHTKLRSGSLVTFVISHRQTDLEIVYRTLALEIEAFSLDPVWQPVAGGSDPAGRQAHHGSWGADAGVAGDPRRRAMDDGAGVSTPCSAGVASPRRSAGRRIGSGQRAAANGRRPLISLPFRHRNNPCGFSLLQCL